MSAAQHNIVVEQGATFEFPLNWKTAAGVTILLATGFTARLVIRETLNGTKIYDSDVDLTELALANTSPNLNLTIPAATTTGFAERKRAVYDLELTTTATGFVERIIEGTCQIVGNVTK